MLTTQVGSCRTKLPVPAGASQSKKDARGQQATGRQECLPASQNCISRFLQSRPAMAALRTVGFPALGSKSDESLHASDSTEKAASPSVASATDIRRVFERNCAVSDSFHDHAEDLDAAVEKVLLGIHTIEAAKADGTEDGILKAQYILSSLGCKKQSNKRGRKPHCPLLKEICCGIKQEIEQKEQKKEQKRQLHHKTKKLKAQEAAQIRALASLSNKKSLSTEGMSVLRMELFQKATAPDKHHTPRLGTSWAALSNRMEEEAISLTGHRADANPMQESSNAQNANQNNNNEDLISVFGGHGSILSFRLLQKRKGSSSSYFHSVLGALKERTETGLAEEYSAKKSYLGGEGFLSSLISSKARLLEDQASIGPELSLYLAHSGSYRMFGDPTYDVEY